MSAYGYGPPPPPPSASAGGYGYPSGPYPQQQSYGRGGAQQGGRGRGGHYGGRGDHQSSPPAHYAYGGHPPYQAHPHPAPYPAASHSPTPGYQNQHQQWAADPKQGHHHPHAPQPLSSANYHPNYAPQSYASSGQYQPPQPAPRAQQPYPAPQQYGPAYPAPSQSNIPHWGASDPSPQPSYGSPRPRGGYSDRGGSRGRHGAPRPGQPSYEYEQVPPPVVNGSYSQPYPPDPRVNQYSPQPYPYAAPPAPVEGASRHEPYYVQNHSQPKRGRGGGNRDHGPKGRGGRANHQRGGHHGGDKPRHDKQSNHKQQPKSENQGAGKKKKRKTNTLGLTPGNESESEDDEGEEQHLTNLIGQEALVIKDVAAYLAERRKHYPTKSRMEAKKAADQAREDEEKAAVLERQADKLRRQLKKVESSIKRKREQGDEGDEMRDSSASESSDDEKPEVMSSRSSAAPALPPPARKADISRHCKYYSTGGSCGKKGKCRFVHDPEVREAAMKEREANNGRLTLQQRLILSDEDQEELAVLQSIQYLREKGFMSAADVKSEKKPNGTSASVKPAATSSLPAAPPSLPIAPHKRMAAEATGTESSSTAQVDAGDPWMIDTSRGTNTQAAEEPTVKSEDEPKAETDKHYHGWLLKPYGQSDDLP